MIAPLPKIMVAPNGARLGKQDHPALPISIAETVATAKACFAAGATGLHAHVRDQAGEHVLDAGLYRELIGEMAVAVPDMQVQITTEAVGRYTPQEQRAVVQAAEPKAVSIALQEMLPEGEDPAEAQRFYHELFQKDVAVQHILYAPEELVSLSRYLFDGIIPSQTIQLLFVLGRYTLGQVSAPSDLDPFLTALRTCSWQNQTDWGLCAFGQAETDCLLYGFQLGGKMRVGFENNLHQRDGTIARDNADRVHNLMQHLKTC